MANARRESFPSRRLSATLDELFPSLSRCEPSLDGDAASRAATPLLLSRAESPELEWGSRAPFNPISPVLTPKSELSLSQSRCNTYTFGRASGSASSRADSAGLAESAFKLSSHWKGLSGAFPATFRCLKSTEGDPLLLECRDLSAKRCQWTLACRVRS